MATANFYNKNASNIYAIFQEDGYEDYIFDDVKDNISNALDAYIKNSKACFGYANKYYRNASLIDIIELTDEITSVPLTVSIEILMRYGHYDGANLDYEINYNIGSVEFDELSAAFQAYIDVATYDSGMGKGLATIQAKNAVKRLENISKELIENVEKILKGNCTHVLQVSARFSNGETWYSELKSS